MLLAGVGDCLGFRNSKREWCKDGVAMHQELADLTQGKGRHRVT